MQAHYLTEQLRAFKRLPKVYAVKVKRTPQYNGHTSHYALVRVHGDGHTITLPYETFRKFMERLDGQPVSMQMDPAGLHVSYRNGNLFLKHVPGDWPDLAEVSL